MECEIQNEARAGKCERQARRATKQCEQDTFDQRLSDKPRRARPQRHAQRYLPPPFHPANEHESRDVGAGNQQDESGDHHQDLEPVLVLLAHARDARAAGTQVEGLFGKPRSIVGPVRAQPLLELDPHFSLDRSGRHTWLDAADHVQPVGIVLVEIGIDMDQWLCVQW